MVYSVIFGSLFRRRRLVSRRRKKSPASEQAFTAHKELARKLVVERLEHYNRMYRFTYHRIAIRNQSTRWGSCSKKGNLNFNYRIALLPLDVADYIIVHELCHLGEFNHSPRFWLLVSKALPDYQLLRQRLRVESKKLHSI